MSIGVCVISSEAENDDAPTRRERVAYDVYITVTACLHVVLGSLVSRPRVECGCDDERKGE